MTGISMEDNLSVISSVAAAVAAVAALITIFITILDNKKSRHEKHLSVQPWFCIDGTSTSRGGDFEVHLSNEGYLNVSIEKIELLFILPGKPIDLKFKYEKPYVYSKLGKKITVFIPWNEELYGKPVQLKITYRNLYKVKMTAFSGRRLFIQQTHPKASLDFKASDNYHAPFFNQIK